MNFHTKDLQILGATEQYLLSMRTCAQNLCTPRLMIRTERTLPELYFSCLQVTISPIQRTALFVTQLHTSVYLQSRYITHVLNLQKERGLHPKILYCSPIERSTNSKNHRTLLYYINTCRNYLVFVTPSGCSCVILCANIDGFFFVL